MRASGRELWWVLLIVGGCQGTIDPGEQLRPGESKPGVEAGAGMNGAAAATGAGGTAVRPSAAGAGAAGSAADPSGEPALDCSMAAVEPGPAPMRLLTREQYLNTVHALVGEVPG